MRHSQPDVKLNAKGYLTVHVREVHGKKVNKYKVLRWLCLHVCLSVFVCVGGGVGCVCVPFIYEKLAKSCGNKLRQQTQQTLRGRGISNTRKQAKSTEESRREGRVK